MVHDAHVSTNLALVASEHLDLAHGHHGACEVPAERRGVPVRVDAPPRARILHERLVGAHHALALDEAQEVVRVELVWRRVHEHLGAQRRRRTLTLQGSRQPRVQSRVRLGHLNPVVKRKTRRRSNSMRT
jgi:hypothetical protein